MELITIIVYISTYLGLFATTFYALSFISDRKKPKLLFKDDELPNVSVIIPAYNEEKTIERTIKSLLESDYPKDKFEVIVIDDGSKDETLKKAKKFENEGVKVFHKDNGGKGTALNLGIKKSKGEIVFTMDADTLVNKKSLKKMVRYFKNPKVMLVGPAIVTYKPKNLWQRIQHVEYLLGLFLRKAFSSLNAIYVTPGAFSAYRKSFFEKYGGFDEKNITEDLEIALRIQFNHYKIENCPDAPVYTIPPSKFVDLLKQRRRWYVGLIRNCLKYRRMFSKEYGDLGLFVMPVAWISIFLAIFVTAYFIVKTLLKIKSELIFLNSVNFNLNVFSINIYAIERFLFLLFTKPTMIFIFFFLIVLSAYLFYATKKIGRHNQLIVNVPIYFMFFALLFGFWWILSFVYFIFNRKVGWR